MEKTCSVGEISFTECHKTTYISKTGMENIEDMTENDKSLLKLRVDSEKKLDIICLHHKALYLTRFESLERVCSDPLKKHKKPIKRSLRVITMQQCKQIISKGYKVKPGQKLCSTCRNVLIIKKDGSDEDIFHASDNDDKTLAPPQVIADLEKQEAVEGLNSSLTEIGCSPLKLHALGESSKISYAKHKLEKFQGLVKNKLEMALNVELPDQNIPSCSQDECVIKQKAADMDKLIEIISEKLRISNKAKQIQILTVPASLEWSRKKIRENFEVSDYAVRQAQKLYKEKGILSEPDMKRGKKLSSQTTDLVRSFYQDDEHSRILPGMKDVVSLGKKQYERKRLILSNLNEMYSTFKWQHPDVKIGFSKFCALRPKWCVLPGSSGTHSVCVCTYHQNVKLLIEAAGIDEDYKMLRKYMLCEDASRECFLRHCNKCPPEENLLNFLKLKFEDSDESDTIEFSQWVSTDRTQMVKCSSAVDDFINDLTKKIEQLIPHSYIAKTQSTFLKYMKEHFSNDTAIILMDFSENYSFTIQDEAQGYHWTCNTCTIHPVMIYLQDDQGKKITTSLCVISNDLKHDVAMVYETQTLIIKFLKDNFPHVKKIHYYTDGCAAQYKNKYNFLNLCYHEQDFAIKAEWSFFATSHGKSECDGIGGTVKRLVRKESLQRPLQQQIITTDELFKFCKSHIYKINFYLVLKETVDLTRQKLETRYKNVHTLPGTRSFHNFRPMNTSGTVEARRISEDEFPALTYCLNKQNVTLVKESDLFSGRYVACKYDHLWYFGVITSIDKEEGDVTVKFFHPNGPSPSFSWPRREDSCAVPLPHVLAVVDPPFTTSGRTYHFDPECMKSINEKMIV